MTDTKFLLVSCCNILIRKSNKMKFYIIIGSAFLVFFCVCYIYNSLLIKKLIADATVRLNLEYVIVHIDLKGSPPKLKYLESLLPLFKSYGVNGLLMEYEDMFPYQGRLVNLSAEHCYKESELRTFLTKAVDAGFEIIPVIQTFGHMEHVLKLKEFQHLREDIAFPDSICPSKVESLEIIQQMLIQVISFHAVIHVPLKYIHIGCDEVYRINTCAQCTSKKLSNMSLFLDHVNNVSNIVKNLSPSTTVLIWEDMLRKTTKAELFKLDRLKNVEPVYWDYSTNVTLSHVHLLNYHRRFNNIWIASAFKGADGRTEKLPDFGKRLSNHLTWMDAIRNYIFGGEKTVFNFKGIILTGWSRYSHMDPLCELLPASLPALAVNLFLIKTLKNGFLIQYPNIHSDKYLLKSLEKDLKMKLKCKDDVNISKFKSLDRMNCSFDGIELYNELIDYLLIKNTIGNHNLYINRDFYLRSRHFGNLDMFINNKEWCNATLTQFIGIEKSLIQTMKKYYAMNVIEEFLDYNIRPIRIDLEMLQRSLDSYPKSRSWGRRSYKNNMISDSKLSKD